MYGSTYIEWTVNYLIYLAHVNAHYTLFKESPFYAVWFFHELSCFVYVG
jgi:hypothetical protein